MNLLFVCSRNKWRSRTAETLFKNHPLHTVRSAGTSESARVRLTEKMLLWADIIFVMENKHRRQIQEKFGANTFSEKIIVLAIPDEYEYMNGELIALLEAAIAPYAEAD